MATPTPPTGPNIGTSRLIGTNNLQQAVDSLTTQVNKLASSLSSASASFNRTTASNNRATGGNSGSNWNGSSNRANYGNNGGGGNFTTGNMTTGSGGGRARNGGGGFFGMSGGTAAGGAKFAMGAAVVAGAAAAVTNYGNKNMSTNMQMDYFNSYANVAGGGSSMTARHMVFDNNNVALSIDDAARAAYVNSYTFGNAQFGGRANPAFQQGFRQTQGFGYASPTLGAEAAATAAQQTYTARSLYMSQALGLASPIGPGGVKNSMSNIAQSIYQRTFGNQKVSQQGFNAAISQGGSLAVNLQYFGQQMGWNQTTIQEYQNYLQGLNAATNNGMSASQYDQLSQQASQGNKTAINQLAKATGLGTSMFEHQKNLNATRVTRQSDILDSLAPAFDKATDTVNKFSEALTTLLKSTGLDKVIGTGAGWGSALSGAMGGFSSGFGLMGGVMGAARMFGGGGGGFLGGLGGFFGRGGGAAASGGGFINAARGAGGVYNITSMAGGAAGGAGLLGRMGGFLKSPGAKAGGLGLAGWGVDALGHPLVDKLSKKGTTTNKVANGAVSVGSGALTGAAIGSLIGPEGTAAGAIIGGLWGLGTSIFGGGPGGSTGNMGGVAKNSSPQGAGTANAAQIIQYAQTQLGVPYVWGGESPGQGMDCSGLIQWAYSKAGVQIPRVAEDQQNTGTPIPVNQAQPGDLLFNGKPAHHVVMAIGGGKVIEAPRTGLNVRIRSYSPSEFDSATRIVGNLGNLNSLLNSNDKGGQNTLSSSQSRSGGNVGSYGGTSEAEAIASALAGSVASMPLNAGSKGAANTAGTSPIGQDPVGGGGNDKASLQAYAKQLLSKFGWGDQWNSFNALVMSESGWDTKATNPSSGAYGIPQSLPGSKMSSAGSDWQTSGETQLRWMMDYIKDRYKSPDSAWSFHQKNNWYDVGAWNIDKDQNAVVHQGEMIIPAKQAETIRQVLLNNSFNPNNNKAYSPGSGFQIGQIVVQMPQGYTGTQQEAQSTGKMIVDTIFNDSRIRNLQIGQ